RVRAADPMEDIGVDVGADPSTHVVRPEDVGVQHLCGAISCAMVGRRGGARTVTARISRASADRSDVTDSSHAVRAGRAPDDPGDGAHDMADDAELRERTQKTARMLFHTLKGGTGFETWKKFDKELARELSMFFTGKLYSREVISQKQRELCAVASLTVLNRRNEVRAHLHAALNVGATRQEVAEVIFQQVTYGGMPVVVEALEVLKQVLEERGEWEA